MSCHVIIFLQTRRLMLTWNCSKSCLPPRIYTYHDDPNICIRSTINQLVERIQSFVFCERIAVAPSNRESDLKVNPK